MDDLMEVGATNLVATEAGQLVSCILTSILANYDLLDAEVMSQKKEKLPEGLQSPAKEGKMNVPASNLSKSKSKSMVGVNQKFGSSSRAAPTLTGRASLAPPRKPLTKPAPAPATTDRRQTTTALNDRTNVRYDN